MRALDPDRVAQQVALRIAELRRANGLTQEQVADRLGMPLRNFQRIESGVQNLTIRMLVRIAVALDVDPAAFWLEPSSARPRRGRPPRRRE